jgi:hypothetical protein
MCTTTKTEPRKSAGSAPNKALSDGTAPAEPPTTKISRLGDAAPTVLESCPVTSLALGAVICA